MEARRLKLDGCLLGVWIVFEGCMIGANLVFGIKNVPTGSQRVKKKLELRKCEHKFPRVAISQYLGYRTFLEENPDIFK